jgi:hypothetical protein
MKLIEIRETTTHVIASFSGKTKFIQKTFEGKKKINVYYENACVYKTEDSNFAVFFYKSDFPKSIPYYEDLNN